MLLYLTSLTLPNVKRWTCQTHLLILIEIHDCAISERWQEACWSTSVAWRMLVIKAVTWQTQVPQRENRTLLSSLLLFPSILPAPQHSAFNWWKYTINIKTQHGSSGLVFQFNLTGTSWGPGRSPKKQKSVPQLLQKEMRLAKAAWKLANTGLCGTKEKMWCTLTTEASLWNGLSGKASVKKWVVTQSQKQCVPRENHRTSQRYNGKMSPVTSQTQLRVLKVRPPPMSAMELPGHGAL